MSAPPRGTMIDHAADTERDSVGPCSSVALRSGVKIFPFRSGLA